MKQTMLGKKELRLILGDQLNISHSWYKVVDEEVTYVIMEVRSETDYATHHIQKVVGFFTAMRQFCKTLLANGHKVIYIYLNQESNTQSIDGNIIQLIEAHQFNHFSYQLPDEYRLDDLLVNLVNRLNIPCSVVDTEHFLSTRYELQAFFKGKKQLLMESYYRHMRKKHNVLMSGEQPLTGRWNYDDENRKKMPAAHRVMPPLMFENNVNQLFRELSKADLKTIGKIDAKNFVWPVNREQALELLQFFVTNCLSLFGTYQDAMTESAWSLYHSRLSFSLNIKLISPEEVINKAIEEWSHRKAEIEYNQVEGFVRQIIGWREYMRGIYWAKMPHYAQLNYFNHTNKLPQFYWTGNTKMKCLSHSINQSLNYAYAHHIQRLMVTGNFALLAQVHPDEVDKWYLGIYIDALEWVEITNTRGMSQFADGGLVATKPYISSAAYINKMSSYCNNCYYEKSKKTGNKACPFNSLYWNFYDTHRSKLSGNPRIGMMYHVWDRMQPLAKAEILEQARYYLEHLNEI